MLCLLSVGLAVLFVSNKGSAMTIATSSHGTRTIFEEHESIQEAVEKFARHAFGEADTDANLCLTPEEFLGLFDFYDADGNRRVSVAEFVAISWLERVISSTVNARRVFASGDLDGNDYIDRDTDVPEMRRRMGADGQQCVTRDSFLRRFSQVASMLSRMYGNL